MGQGGAGAGEEACQGRSTSYGDGRARGESPRALGRGGRGRSGQGARLLALGAVVGRVADEAQPQARLALKHLVVESGKYPRFGGPEAGC